MKRRKYLIIMIGIMTAIIFSGCSVNKKEKNICKNSAFENLDITINEENIKFDKFGDAVEVTETLAKQVVEKLPEEVWDDDYCGIAEENDVEYMNWFGQEV